MSKSTSRAKENPEWQQFELSFNLTATLKKEVLAVIKKKMKEAMKTLELPEAGLEAVCSPYLSVEVFVKQNAATAIIPGNMKEGDKVNLTTGKTTTKKPQENFIAGAIAGQQAETLMFRGAVKDPPSTPDPLIP